VPLFSREKVARMQEKSKKETLVKELKQLLPKLDDEGLMFLLDQAQILLYNMQVSGLHDEDSESKGISSKTSKQKRIKELRIEAAGDKSSYYIVFDGQWIMFTDEEMLQMVKIISVKDSQEEVAERLYRWFERERTDVFGVIPIKNQFDEELFKVLDIIKKTFKIKYK
jgi:hypothetical protein